MSSKGIMKILVAICLAGQYLQVVLAARILTICGVPSPSHSLWCYKYMALLAERGHQITVLGLDPPQTKIPNLTTFIASEVHTVLDNKESINGWFVGKEMKIQTMLNGYANMAERSSRAFLHSRALKNLINQYKNVDKPFDLIIHDNGNAEALLGLVPLFGNPPLLLATAFGSPQWMNFNAGNILNPAYVPNMMTSLTQHMTFYERCLNTFYYVFLEWYDRKLTDMQDDLKKEVFGNHIPHVRELVRRANIVLVNYDPAVDGPRPHTPGLISIPGLHISEPQPLPQQIQNFMDGAENGAILISFGTNLDSKWFRPGFERIILSAVQQLPQRVIWKWDKEVANIPSNLKIYKWLPVGDMLVHPKLKLFITHCGLLSTQEALHYAVPVLALPAFLDQMDNAAKMVQRGFALSLNPGTVTADQLLNATREIISNPKYKDNIQQVSRLLRDVPRTAQQQAVFWTEYALRHAGAPHLRSPAADMSWLQLLLIDVFVSLLLCCIAIYWLVKKSLSIVLGRLFSKVKTKSD